MDNITPQGAPVETPPNPGSHKKLWIIVGSVISVLLIGGGILAAVLLTAPKLGTSEEFATMLVRVNSVGTVLEEREDNARNLMEDTYDSYPNYPDDQFKKSVTTLKTNVELAKKILQKVSDTKTSIDASRDSTAAIEAYLIATREDISQLLKFAADLDSGTDALLNARRYVAGLTNPIGFFSLQYKDTAQLQQIGKTATADLQHITEQLTAWQPETDLMKTIKDQYLISIRKHAEVASQLSVADGKTPYTNYANQVNAAQINDDPISQKFSDTFTATFMRGNIQTGSTAVTALRGYMSTKLKLDKDEITQAQLIAADALGAELGQGLLAKIRQDIEPTNPETQPAE